MIQLPLLGATFEGSDTLPTITRGATSPFQGIVKPVQRLVAMDRHKFASEHDDSVPAGSSVQSIIVRAVTPDHHVLPTDDPLRALNILREAAGLPPLSDEHDNEGG